MTEQPSTNSLARKSVALGFVTSILLGNFWFIMELTGQKLPFWFGDAFIAVTAWILLSGLWMLLWK